MNSPGKSQNTIRLRVVASPENNDFEVCIDVDGVDFIEKHWKGMIGIDPDDLLTPGTILIPAEEPHDAVIARCGGCGIVECDSRSVKISRVTDTVFWTFRPTKGKEVSPGVLCFNLDQYMAELDRAILDKTWESPDRTAARLLRGLYDEDNLSRHGLSWQWASGRTKKDMFTVSLGLDPGLFQILVHTRWHGESADEMARQVADLLMKPPRTWPDVEWNPVGENQEASPDVAGPGWRRLS